MGDALVTPLRIFIGYDPSETVAYHVLSQSLLRHASGPITISPLVQSALRASGLYTRPPDEMASTEFSLTRFLVPALSRYEGISIFMDCDMLCQSDIYALVDAIYAQPSCHVAVCQHTYTPSTSVKMEGQRQYVYPRKNWSSLMVFKNARCRALTPEYVNRATPGDLHQFRWTQQVGTLPLTWNWLVGEYAPNPSAHLLHYTLGGPWFRDHQRCDQADAWFDELDRAFPTLNLPKPVEA